MFRSLPVLLLLALPIIARADDLADILERDRIATQKLVADTNDALAKTKNLDKADLAQVKKGLENAIVKVTDAKELPEAERKTLRERLQTRLAEVNRLVRVQEITQEEAAKRAAEKRKREQDAAPGQSLTDTAKRQIGATKNQIAAADQLRVQKAKGELGVFASLEASATPIDGVVEYPKYWAKLTETRKNFAGTKLTPKEVSLLKALNSTLSVDFKNNTFKDVIEYLQLKTGLTIVVDETSLKEAMVEYGDPVNFKVQNVTVRTILKKVLADRGLAYILQEGTVQVVTNQRARDAMVVRSYPIDDLVGLNNQFYGPFLNRAIMLNNVQTLIQNIQNAIDPSLWNVNGGPGSITFFEPSRSLIVRAPAEMHYMFGGGGLFGR